MTTFASTRFEFRLRSDAKQRIEKAAALLHESASDFVRTAVEERAERVLREHLLMTVVPTEFFDDLLQTLHAPARPNEALKAAAHRARGAV